MSFKTKVGRTYDTVKKNGAYVVAAAGTMLASAGAMALDATVETAIDTQVAAVQADGLAIAAKVWPVLIILMGAGIGMKLFKRFFSKI